mmetsp:Transcript_111573/g.315062  ORF Transcript_111573/g.315062 Transcript_111573/m.315062 type:complete len:243 (-) Transcript_111573:128-856(-)
MRGEVIFLEIWEVAGELRASKHALVVDHARRKRANIEWVARVEIRGVGSLAAQHEERGLELARIICQSALRSDEALFDGGLEVPCGRSEAIRNDRHAPPTQETQSRNPCAKILDNLFALFRGFRLLCKEHVADRVLPLLWQLDALLVRNAVHELVRDAAQDSGAIAGVHLATLRATVIEVVEDLESTLHDVPALGASERGVHPHTTGILLVLRVVKALLRRAPIRVERRWGDWCLPDAFLRQ